MRIAITGASDGIGKETAAQLAEQGHSVVVIGRPGEKSGRAAREIEERAARELGRGTAGGGSKAAKSGGSQPPPQTHSQLQSQPQPQVDLRTADLSSMASVRELGDRLAADFPDLQVLVNNAAVIRKRRQETVDGLEETFAVNYLAHFLLTNRILPRLKENAPARIVNVSSMVHESGDIDFDDLQAERRYDPSFVYAQSKAAMVLFTRELARRLESTGVTANALHPGVINTKLLHVLFSGGAPVERGAETSVYLASSPEVEGVSGRYFKNRRPARSRFLEGGDEEARRLWELSEQLC